MAAKQHTDGTDEQAVEFDFDVEGSDRDRAQRMLEEFGDSWKVADGLAADSEIRGMEAWDAIKTVQRELRVTEALEPIEMPPSEAPDDDEFISYVDRFEHAPSTYEDEEIEVHDYRGSSLKDCGRCDTSGRMSCPKCSGSLQISCPTCNGDGRESCQCSDGTVTCQGCGGDGTVGSGEDARTCQDCSGSGSLVCRDCNGAGDFRCSRCGGAGDVTCPKCGGDGDVTCTKCKGEQQLYVAEEGTVSFESEKSVEVSKTRGGKDRWFRRPAGDRTDHTVHTDGGRPSGDGVVRSETETLAVPAHKLRYSFGGDDWSLFDVSGTLYADSYPKSTARRLAPYVALVVVAALAAGGYYYFAVL